MLMKASVSSEKTRYAQGETIRLHATIQNTSKQPVFLVMGRTYPSPPISGVMTITHGQVPCDENVSYFGFIPPELRALGPNRTTQFKLGFAMPLHQYGIGSDGKYFEREVAISGIVRLGTLFGWLPNRFRPTSDDPWGDFTRLQKFVGSRKITIEIAL
jgi:hypothetical protein